MVSKIAGILLIIGGLNWGLVGIADFNLVTTLFGETIITTIVYALVGISAIVAVIDLVKGNSATV